MANEDELIAQYSGITGESAAKSRQYLEAFDWNIQSAIEDHYSRQQGSENDPDYEEDSPQEGEQESFGGGRRLGDGPSTSRPIPVAPLSSTSNSKSKSAPRKKFATLTDFGAGDPKEDTDEDEHQDLFAGGEKSGLAVQNPDDLKKKIIEKAAKTPRQVEEPTKQSNFKGNARTLGGDDAPSREIPGEAQTSQAERVRRILHFWRDGFSVDDGDLYRFDDQRNAEMLQLIRSGRAPLHIMNVAAGQEVDVEVRPHEEDYVKPKKVFKPFEGQGNRLGSPTPGASSSSMPGAFTTDDHTAAQSTNAGPPATEVDNSKPTVTLRISLGSGTRLTSRFNTEQTIGDVYDFVRRAETSGRSFVLQTTFPTTELTDHSKVLGDMAEFKRGGAVVQKYT